MHIFSQSSIPFSILFTLLTLSIILLPISCKTHTYLLNCGLTTTTVDDENQTWTTDETTTFAPLSAYNSATTAAEATNVNPSSFNQSPCTAARVFHSPFTYSFPVSPGPKIVRLHFCVATYGGINGDQFFLTVTVNGGSGSFTLLRNFSAYLYNQQFVNTIPGQEGKEFLVMAKNSRLNLTFLPTKSNSFAFVNGIQIVDVPEKLYDYFSPQSAQVTETSSDRTTPCFPPTTINNQLPFSLFGSTSLELVARLNVGGNDIYPPDDQSSMFRTWYNDYHSIIGNFAGSNVCPNSFCDTLKINYTTLVPNYTAPTKVYSSARFMGKLPTINFSNITWSILVDYGFSYVVRLHFCEIDSVVTRVSQRMFDVFIDGQVADRDIDVMDLANGWASPVCKDYVAPMYGNGGEDATKVPLLITLRPEEGLLHPDIVLNGLEIFKLNGSDGSLAGPNPDPPTDQSNVPKSTQNRRKSGHVIGITIGIITGCVVVLMLLLISAFVVCLRMSQARTNECKRLLQSESSSLPTHLCHHFTLQQIKSATRNFDDSLVIGVGGFGKVYKGSIKLDEAVDDVTVAIKRLNPSSKQGAHEFRTEIEMLTALRHMNLVSLIGYCNEGEEMVLVYEYMPLGTLRDHLYLKSKVENNFDHKSQKYAPMTWKQRLMICIGAARGLHYLHTGTKRVIIHRDVKSTNILLDENFMAKVSDFGISKAGALVEEVEPNHISTKVKGSHGYLDPEYFRLNQLTEKTDVYSFGVVLFEVLCARPAILPNMAKEQVNLALYAKNCHKDGTLRDIVDPNIRGKIAPESLKKFGDIAEMCVRDFGTERPSMGEVVWYLEFALQLQETADENNNISSSLVVNYDELTTTGEMSSSSQSSGYNTTKNSETN